MSITITTYEVKVKIKSGIERYSSFLGMYIQDEIIKMFHKDARTSEQAMQKCEKYGRPISAHKADVSKMYGNMEALPLMQEPYGGGNLYENAIAMDEFIWKKKNREKRIKNREKDK